MFTKTFIFLASVSATLNCGPTEMYARQPGMDTWCNTNCAVGNCPASHCICEDSPTAAPSTTEAPGTTAEPSTTGSNGSGGCRPTETYASQPGMDTWCNDNCPRFCPETHCICDGAATTSAPWTQPQEVPTEEDSTITLPTEEESTVEHPTEEETVTEDDQDDMRSYYSWSWTGGDVGPANSNAGVFFNGYNNVDNALVEWNQHQHPLQGEKWFSIGGGNWNGIINADVLSTFVSDIHKIVDAGFEAVMFDVEKVHGSSASMNPKFAEAFAAVKAAGMKVGITVSHSAPYETDTPQDAANFVSAFVQDTNVDLISPQLYTSGWENSPDFAVTGNCAQFCTWDLYHGMHAGMRFVPSIANANQYNTVKAHFEQMGISSKGYVQWQQVNRRLDTLII